MLRKLTFCVLAGCLAMHADTIYQGWISDGSSPSGFQFSLGPGYSGHTDIPFSLLGATVPFTFSLQDHTATFTLNYGPSPSITYIVPAGTLTISDLELALHAKDQPGWSVNAAFTDICMTGIGCQTVPNMSTLGAGGQWVTQTLAPVPGNFVLNGNFILSDPSGTAPNQWLDARIYVHGTLTSGNGAEGAPEPGTLALLGMGLLGLGALARRRA